MICAISGTVVTTLEGIIIIHKLTEIIFIIVITDLIVVIEGFPAAQISPGTWWAGQESTNPAHIVLKTTWQLVIDKSIHEHTINALPVTTFTWDSSSTLISMSFLREVVLHETGPALQVLLITRWVFLKEVKPAYKVFVLTRHQVGVFSFELVPACPVIVSTEVLFDLGFGVVFEALPAVSVVPFTWWAGQESINPLYCISSITHGRCFPTNSSQQSSSPSSAQGSSKTVLS